MLKKCLHISVILLLLLATTGVSISRHYCGGNLISTSLYHEKGPCCGDTCNSCHNETSFSKIDNDFIYSTKINLSITSFNSFKNLFSAVLLYYNTTSIPINHISTHFNDPPPTDTSHHPEFLEIFRC